ncbi:hypothetical protein LO771_13465 [Streptacidiphilus sp. ASG 303]|uniref:hypothetical protein n=1 Tax=Streptacidiphilus sp. ASG 303 TaxID=2896847 RepID=UPI001E63673F|nr:hypothetical protein [Streptacidiphilus sp. ASG 303]MCD0483383.1 hypothetical protein [Streptacidiphilus sp. ASG 303]
MTEEIRHNFEETERLAARFSAHSEHLHTEGGTHLGAARHHFGRTRGRGSLAQAAESGVEKLLDSVTKAQKALTEHLDKVARGHHQANANHRAHEQSVADALHGIRRGDAGRDGPTPPHRGGAEGAGGRPRELEAGPSTGPTTDDVRNWRSRRRHLEEEPGERRWAAGERAAARLWGGRRHGNHVPVATHDHAPYPVTGSGGRHVDVTAHDASGRRYHVEVKTYQRWKTVNGTPVEQFVPLSDDLFEQIAKDVATRRRDPDVQLHWDFMDAHPSPALRNALLRARIVFTTRN